MAKAPVDHPISRKVLAVVGDLYREELLEPDVFGAARFMDGLEVALQNPDWARALLTVCTEEGMPAADCDWLTLIPLETMRHG